MRKSVLNIIGVGALALAAVPFRAQAASEVTGVTLESADGGLRVTVSGSELTKPQVRSIRDSNKVLAIFPGAGLAPGVVAPKAEGPATKARIDAKAAINGKPKEVWLVLELNQPLEAKALASGSDWLINVGAVAAAAPPASSPAPAAAPSAAAPAVSATALPSGASSAASSTYRIISVDARMVDDDMRVIITGDGTLVYRVSVKDNPTRIEADFLGAGLALDENEIRVNKGSLKNVIALAIRKGADPLSRLTLNLTEIVPHTVTKQSANQIVITLSPAPVVEKAMPRKLDLNHKVTLDVQGQDLEGLCRAIVEESGGEFGTVGRTTNIGVLPVLDSFVDLKLHEVPLWKALIEILSPLRLSYYQDGNKVVIGPVQDIIIRNKAYMEKDWESDTIYMGSMPVSEFSGFIKPFLSPGNVALIIPDDSRNAVIVKALHQDILEIRDLINLLDLRDLEKDFRITRLRVIGRTTDDAVSLVGPLLSPNNKLGKTLKLMSRGGGAAQVSGPAGGSMVIADKATNEFLVKGLPEDIEELKRLGKKLGIGFVEPGDGGSEGDLVTKVYYLKWQNADDTVSIVKPHMSIADAPATGYGVKIQVDSRENRIILTDTASAIAKISKFIDELDVATRQVMIEAKLVNVREGALKDLGVDWLGTGPKLMGKTVSGFAINAPSTPNALNFGILNPTVNLDATISAMQEDNKAEVVSSPRIAVRDGDIGSFRSSETTFYKVINYINGPGGTQVPQEEFKALEIPISLQVLPRTNDKGFVQLQITATVSSAGTRVSANAPPDVSTQTTTTNVTVQGGDTLVIGGLVRNLDSTSTKKVPILNLIPILGKLLFTSERKEKSKVELIIFLTPRVLDNLPRGESAAS